MTDSSTVFQEIEFPNGNRAKMLVVSDGANATEIVQALGLDKSKALIVLLGGAKGLDDTNDAELKSRLVQLFTRGIARAATEGVTIIDGGTDSGVMAMMGQGVAAQGRKARLLGVAPEGKAVYPEGPDRSAVADSAPLEPNHSYFVLVKSDAWGGESKMLAALAQEIGNGIPAVTILVGGGDISKQDLLYSVRQRWPIIAVQGSGNLADQVATLWENKRKATGKPPFISDPVLAEIIADGTIYPFQVSDTTQALEQTINWYLGFHSTLALAWGRFALYDHNSKLYRDQFRSMQRWIMRLGLSATIIVLTLTQFKDLFAWTLPFLFLGRSFTLHDLVRLPVIALPISISVLIAWSNRFNPGSKYILLRAAAERVKGEIYTYRTRAGIYADDKKDERKNLSPEAWLQKIVEDIGRGLLQTDVKDSAMKPYQGPLPPAMDAAVSPDDGFSDLAAERYDQVRLEDQISFHRYKVGKLSTTLHRYQWMIYIIGGMGTFLAAIGLELWIALTAAMAAAFTTMLQYDQVEFTMARNTQTLLELQNIRAWWRALSPAEKAMSTNRTFFVDTAEKTLSEENVAWVRQMSDAVNDLRAEQGKKEKQATDETFQEAKVS